MDKTGEPVSDEDIAQALEAVHTAMVQSIMKVPPELGVELANISRCLRELQALRKRQSEHLALIARLSRDSISEAEAEELRGQVASLISEVGSLRAEVGEVRLWRADDQQG